MLTEWSITVDEEISLHLGSFNINGVPSLELANMFIQLAYLKGIDGSYLNDNGTLGLVGGIVVQEILALLEAL